MRKDATTRISVLVFIGVLASAALATRGAAGTAQGQTVEDCDSYRTTLSDLNNQYDQTNAALQAANASLTELRASLTQTDAARCASNFAYTDSLRKTRKWVSALGQFKEWIATTSLSLDVETRGSVYVTLAGIIADPQFQNENIIDVTQFIDDVVGGYLSSPERMETGAEYAKEDAINELVERRLAELSNKISVLTEEEIKAGEEHADYLDAADVEEQKQLAALDSLSAELVSLNGEIKTVQAKLQQNCGGY